MTTLEEVPMLPQAAVVPSNGAPDPPLYVDFDTSIHRYQADPNTRCKLNSLERKRREAAETISRRRKAIRLHRSFDPQHTSGSEYDQFAKWLRNEFGMVQGYSSYRAKIDVKHKDERKNASSKQTPWGVTQEWAFWRGTLKFTRFLAFRLLMAFKLLPDGLLLGEIRSKYTPTMAQWVEIKS